LQFTDLLLCLCQLFKTLLELLNLGINIIPLLGKQRSESLDQDQIGSRGHIVESAHFLAITVGEFLYTNLHIDANLNDTS